jgi:hypothetical protein
MSTTIKYKNNSGNFITIQQSQQLESYEKHTFINNELKKIERFSYGEFGLGSLFLDSGETYNDFLSSSEQNNYWLVYSDREEIDGFTIWKRVGLLDGNTQAEYSKVVKDNLGRDIAIKYFDENDQAISGCIKWYYLGGKPIILDGESQGYFTEECYYEFLYREDGTMEITPSTGSLDKPYTNLTRFMAEETDGPVLSLMSEEELEFYISPEDYIPNF